MVVQLDQASRHAEESVQSFERDDRSERDRMLYDAWEQGLLSDDEYRIARRTLARNTESEIIL